MYHHLMLISPHPYMLQFWDYLVALQSSSESVSLETIDSFNVASKGSRSPVFGFSTNVKLETDSCRVEFENEKENSSSIMLVFQQLNIRYFYLFFICGGVYMWACLCACTLENRQLHPLACFTID